jgi:hypothetical protein
VTRRIHRVYAPERVEERRQADRHVMRYTRAGLTALMRATGRSMSTSCPTAG